MPDGSDIALRSPHGEFKGRVKRASVRRGNLQVHWPEAMALLSPTALDPESLEPDYNALVTLESGCVSSS